MDEHDDDNIDTISSLFADQSNRLAALPTADQLLSLTASITNPSLTKKRKSDEQSVLESVRGKRK